MHQEDSEILRRRPRPDDVLHATPRHPPRERHGVHPTVGQARPARLRVAGGVAMDTAATSSIEDFDLYEARPLPELHRLNREFREKCPVAHSEHNGGFWYVTSYEHAHAIFRDPETFSNQRGIIIPPIEAQPLIPSDLDPPQHGMYRS